MTIRGFRASSRAVALRLACALVLAATLLGGALAAGGPPASAHAPCSGGSHTHWHVGWWYSHTDHWNDQGMWWINGKLYRQYHIAEHDDYRLTFCGP